MTYALLVISLIAFYFCGYRLMSRLDRFLSSNKAVDNRK